MEAEEGEKKIAELSNGNSKASVAAERNAHNAHNARNVRSDTTIDSTDPTNGVGAEDNDKKRPCRRRKSTGRFDAIIGHEESSPEPYSDSDDDYEPPVPKSAITPRRRKSAELSDKEKKKLKTSKKVKFEPVSDIAESSDSNKNNNNIRILNVLSLKDKLDFAKLKASKYLIPYNKIQKTAKECQLLNHKLFKHINTMLLECNTTSESCISHNKSLVEELMSARKKLDLLENNFKKEITDYILKSNHKNEIQNDPIFNMLNLRRKSEAESDSDDCEIVSVTDGKTPEIFEALKKIQKSGITWKSTKPTTSYNVSSVKDNYQLPIFMNKDIVVKKVPATPKNLNDVFFRIDSRNLRPPDLVNSVNGNIFRHRGV